MPNNQTWSYAGPSKSSWAAAVQVNIDWLRAQLEKALRLLAADGAWALERLPDGCVKADELALDYDHFMGAYLGQQEGAVSASQRFALLRVDDLLEAMSGDHQPELWTAEAVQSHSRWAEVRAAASEALAALGWESESE